MWNLKNRCSAHFAELLSIGGILVFLFIINEPVGKHQDAEMFC